MPSAIRKSRSGLELGRDECADPHVERLIEAFAFLTGRLQHEIDSEFPDITSALSNILYPQLTSPIPSMAIAQFNVAQDQGKMTTGFHDRQSYSAVRRCGRGCVLPVQDWLSGYFVAAESSRCRTRKHSSLELYRRRQ